jgi:hypothetical protein
MLEFIEGLFSWLRVGPQLQPPTDPMAWALGFLALWWPVSAFVGIIPFTCWLANQKGRSVGDWFLLALFFPGLSLLVLMAAPAHESFLELQEKEQKRRASRGESKNKRNATNEAKTGGVNIFKKSSDEVAAREAEKEANRAAREAKLKLKETDTRL